MNKSIILKIALLSLLLTFFFYIPLFANFSLFLNRGNDLQEQFWPVFHFIQKNVFQYRQLPFWNNLFFSGTPLLPDPQFPIFYPFTILFLILPTDTAFIVYFILHTFLGGAGMYLLAKQGFRFNNKASLTAMALYIMTPRMASYLEAGHYGLLGSQAWLPYLTLSVLLLIREFDFRWLCIYIISLVGLFSTHTLVFIYSTILSIVVSLVFLIAEKKPFKNYLFIPIAIVMTLGLIAITLFPQISWSPDTTRFLLLKSPDVYPKWNSIKEFIINLSIPWVNGINGIWNINTEKWITIGVFPIALSILGFFKLPKKIKVLVLFLAFLTIFVSLNNINPFHDFMEAQSWYVLTRVSTRIWFIMSLLIPLTTAFGIHVLTEKLNKNILNLLIGIVIAETLFLSWSYLAKPYKTTQTVTREVYEFLKADHGKFRVFCTTRCISQKQASIYGLELVDGYNTIQQKNYFDIMQPIVGDYWNYYTLSLPPYGSYLFNKLQPNAILLGEYNTKYVISPHKLLDKNYILIRKIDNYFVYLNNLYLPRAYLQIQSKRNQVVNYYSPNFIKMNVDSKKEDFLILSEVYSSGWNAYINGQVKSPITETGSKLREVKIDKNTKYVNFIYEPYSYKLGKSITILTLISIIVTIITRRVIYAKKNKKF